jgi:hypothetical protein
MSHGSRATQVKPEALVILFRANHKKPHYFAGDRKSVSERAIFPGFPPGNLFFAHSSRSDWIGPGTGAQDGAESALRRVLPGMIHPEAISVRSTQS